MSEWKETEIGTIPSDWDVGVFDDDLRVRGRIGWMGYTTSDLVEEGPIVIGGSEIKSTIFLDLKDVKHLRRQKYEESPEIQLKDGDVLLVTRGNLGSVGYFHARYGEATINPSVIILSGFKGDSTFLFYYLISKQGRNNVLSLSSGSSVPAIYQAHVKELKYPKPQIDEQELIGGFFYSIDAKIDLLDRQNRTLEKMAETLFRQWFVEEAEEGWEKGQLGDLLDTIESGSRPKGGIDPNLTGGVPSIGAENINGLGYYDYSKTKFVREDFFDAMKRGLVRDYDVLIYKDGAYIGRKSMFGNGFPFAKCSINEHVFMLRSNIRTNQFFLYFLLEQDEIEQLNANSAQPGINQESLKSLEVTIPNSEKMQQYGSIVKPWIDKVFENCLQIRTLTQMRDTLLPKLMSGEVRVRDFGGPKTVEAEEIPAEVVYTIGHSNHSIEQFISLLKKYGITALGDVRSIPYSRLHPQFNRDMLESALRTASIKYIFLGKQLGARPDDREAYVNGTVQYARLAERPSFRSGLERLLKGRKDYRIALMCAEKEPLDCHRTILVGRYLRKLGVPIRHILGNGELEDNQKTEDRLIELEGLKPTLFDADMDRADRIEKAYEKRSFQIAFIKKPEEE